MLISIAPVFLGAFLSWFKKARPLSVLLLIVGYAAALVSGFVQPIGIAGVMVVALLAWLCSQTLDSVRGVALHIIFLVWAGLLFLHVLPGFQNPLIMGPVSFTPDAIPFKMYFNFDKAAIGFALILLYAPICLVKDFERSLLVGATGAILGIALTLLPALWLGAIRWEPKVPDRLWLWSLDNFLVVALTEETLFRGFLQGSLSRWLKGAGGFAAITFAAIAFGLAHYASGLPMIVFASLAGIAYGFAYRYGGLLASVLAHSGLNLCHILLFTYPLLAPR